MLIDSSSAIGSGKAKQMTIFKKEQEIVLNVLNRSYALILKVKWQKKNKRTMLILCAVSVYLFIYE